MRAKNTDEGWSGKPILTLVGLDGSHQAVQWEDLEAVDGCSVIDGRVQIPSVPRRRFVTATVRGVSTDRLPIPAGESAIEVVVRDPGVFAAPAEAGG